MRFDPDPHTAPEFEHAALLTIDVQNDTITTPGPLEIPGTAQAVPAMARLAGAFREAGRPIVHVVRLYLPDGSNADACRRGAIESGRAALVPGTAGAEIAGPLTPTPESRLNPSMLLRGRLQQAGDNEWFMYKPRWGAFYRTPLERHLRELGITTVVVCGCNFPNCPRTTIYEASERDFRVAMASDAVSGLYARAVRELESIDVAVTTADELLQAMRTAWLKPRNRLSRPQSSRPVHTADERNDGRRPSKSVASLGSIQMHGFSHEDELHQRRQLSMVEAALLEGIHALDISPPSERLLDSRRLRLRWLDWGGGGVNLVFLHGGALTANSWELVCLALRDRFRCVALDARGHGWSEYSDELAYRLEDHVFDVEALLGEIGATPSIVIGHSMGAFVGIALAARNQLAGLILVDAAPGVDLEVARAHLEPLRLLDQRAPVEELLERGGLADPSRDRRLIERALLHNVVAQPDGTWMWRHDRRFDWYREFSSRLEYLDSLTPSITCPVLVVRPTRSRALSPAAVARLVARLARGRSVEIEGSGHNVQSDQPLRLAAAIEDFVRLEIQASSE